MHQFAIFLEGFGFIWGVYKLKKSAGPMEQLAIFPLGVHLRFVQLIKSTGPIQQLTMFPLGFIYQNPRPHGTINDIRIASRVYITPKN